MRPMGLPVLGVLRRERLVPDAQQVFRGLLLRRFGKVKTSGNDGLPIDYYHLVMGNRVVHMDHRRHHLAGKAIRR